MWRWCGVWRRWMVRFSGLDVGFQLLRLCRERPYLGEEVVVFGAQALVLVLVRLGWE